MTGITNFPGALPGLQKADSKRVLQTRALKDLVRKHFELDPDASVFIAEITCGETDCPDAETVIAILEGKTRREFRILKHVHAITGADIAQAVGA